MRIAPAGVSLITARDADGGFHGMAVTSATSLSMRPPSRGSTSLLRCTWWRMSRLATENLHHTQATETK